MLMPGSPAAARPYSVADMVALEGYGAVRANPSGKWAIVEKVMPYGQSPRFTYESFNDRTRTRLYRIDLTANGRLQPLLRAEPDAGYWFGGFSPTGKRLIVFRLQRDRLSAGILTVASDEIRWLPIDPDLPKANPQPVWIDDDHLLMVTRTDGQLPFVLSFYANTPRTLPGKWAAMAAGRAASVDVLDTSTSGAANADTEVRRVDARSGASEALIGGAISDIALSPDKRHVAVIRSNGLDTLDPDHSTDASLPAERLDLVILDLATRQITAPCACAVLPYLLSWNIRGDRLLFASRSAAAWRAAALRIYRPNSGRPAADTTAGRLALPIDDGVMTAHAMWLGDDPVALLDGGAGKQGWFRLRRRQAPVPLPSSGRPSPATEGLWLPSPTGLSYLRPHGHPRAIAGPSTLRPEHIVDPWKDGLRALFNPTKPPMQFITRAGMRDRVISYATSGNGTPSAPMTIPTGWHVVARSPQAAFVIARPPDGSGAMMLLSAGRPPVTVDRINTHLAGIDLPEPHRLTVRLADGSTAEHWLLIPPYAGTSRLPLVVLPYPGTIYGTTPPDLAPDRLLSAANPLLLTAAGYAVLLPSINLPLDEHEPLAAIAPVVEQAVQAAIDSGLVDPERVAIYGQSYGGYTALGLAARSGRYKAVVASAAVANLTSNYGSIDPRDRRGPVALASMRATMAWTETGQGRMGSAPWANAGRFLRNSPYFDVDKIRAPVLLIQGDLDFVSAQQGDRMWSALSRLGRDATLLRYAGEAHTLVSPANIADQWRRILTWLAEKLALPTDRAPGSTSAPTPRNSQTR
jgi:dipeptidyl aminopeptidase/acylaminoacyl peptidase